jgi:hypothetical protein
MDKKTIFIIIAVILVLFFVKIMPSLNSDSDKIRNIILSAKTATEKENILKCISYLSLDYNDKHGNNRGSIFLICQNVFREYDGILIIIEDMKVDVIDSLNAKAHVVASGQGKRQENKEMSLFLDTERVEFDVAFKKESGAWKVVNLNFIKPDDFLQALKGL